MIRCETEVTPVNELLKLAQLYRTLHLKLKMSKLILIPTLLKCAATMIKIEVLKDQVLRQGDRQEKS